MAGLTILFFLWSIVFPASMERVVKSVFNWTTQGWGWLYLLTVFALIIACFVPMVRKSEDMKLGLPTGRHELSNIT